MARWDKLMPTVKVSHSFRDPILALVVCDEEVNVILQPVLHLLSDSSTILDSLCVRVRFVLCVWRCVFVMNIQSPSHSPTPLAGLWVCLLWGLAGFPKFTCWFCQPRFILVFLPR